MSGKKLNKMEFTIRNTTIRRGTPPPSVTKTIAFLDKLPDGELLPYTEAEERIGYGRCALARAKEHPAMAGYWVLGKERKTYLVLLANPRTIKAYKKEFGA